MFCLSCWENSSSSIVIVVWCLLTLSYLPVRLFLRHFSFFEVLEAFKTAKNVVNKPQWISVEQNMKIKVNLYFFYYYYCYQNISGKFININAKYEHTKWLNKWKKSKKWQNSKKGVTRPALMQETKNWYTKKRAHAPCHSTFFYFSPLMTHPQTKIFFLDNTTKFLCLTILSILWI